MGVPTMVIILQINPFCNCKGHVREVEDMLCKLGGVKLLSMEPEIGKFTVSTVKRPEVVRVALDRKFYGKVVILSQQTILPNPLPAVSKPCKCKSIIHQNPTSLVTLQGRVHVNVDDMAKILAKISPAKGLIESMEFTQSNTWKINFINRENQPAASGTVPPPTTQPSAPPAQPPVYGYLPDQSYIWST